MISQIHAVPLPTQFQVRIRGRLRTFGSASGFVSAAGVMVSVIYAPSS